MVNILEKINKAAMNFLEPLTAEETYARVVQEAVKLVNADYGSLFLEDEKGELIRSHTTLPISSEVKIRRDGFTYEAFQKQKTIVMHDNEFLKFHPQFEKLGVKSNIFIPVAYRKKSIGTLIVNSCRHKHFQGDELHALELFGSMASLVIRKAQLHEETQKAIETRDLFFSMAAHELRTPITTIYGYAQLLQNKMKDEDSAEARWIRDLYTESYRLTLLVHDLLEINRIRTGRLQYVWKECSLREIISRALRSFQLNYPQRSVVYEDQLGKRNDLIIGDFDRLLQLTLNLLDNAAKFSTVDQPITLTLQFKSPTYLLSIADKGKGIARNDLPKVFEGFYRGSNHQTEGMGLGLYLAKSIIDEHHGSIQIQSRLNKGTTVKLKLPKAKI